MDTVEQLQFEIDALKLGRRYGCPTTPVPLAGGHAECHSLCVYDQRDGCPYHVTSYRDDDHSSLDSPFGVQVHHPRFLEWVDVPEWLQVMTRQDMLHAALQLQRNASLTVLHQYAISLHRAASEILHSVFGQEFFQSTAVNDAAPVPPVLRASAHLAAMSLWRPPVGPGGPGLDTVHQGPQCPGCPLCHPRPSG